MSVVRVHPYHFNRVESLVADGSKVVTKIKLKLNTKRGINKKIGIIDADLIGRKKHRFPNLACMKLSAFHKKQGDEVILKFDYENLDDFDKVYISKVFTDTEIPGEPLDKTNKNCDNISEWYADNEFLKQENITYGGTGFFYDKAESLPEEIEHIIPDYHLYDEWVDEKIAQGKKRDEFKYYLDYSIGFLTRGCFRKCPFCVNRSKSKCVPSSPIAEFVDEDRPKICLQDDNFFACSDWKRLITDLKSTGKAFQFKQGLDERLLTSDKVEELFNCKTDGDLIFAFDNIDDKEIIEEKLKMIRLLYPNSKKTLKFYTFCGCDRKKIYDEKFWIQDIVDCFKRIEILMQYKCIPYITRFEEYVKSPYKGMYINLARWCNQPSFFKKKSFREFCEANGLESACYKYMKNFEEICPEISRYFDLKFESK